MSRLGSPLRKKRKLCPKSLSSPDVRLVNTKTTEFSQVSYGELVDIAQDPPYSLVADTWKETTFDSARRTLAKTRAFRDKHMSVLFQTQDSIRQMHLLQRAFEVGIVALWIFGLFGAFGVWGVLSTFASIHAPESHMVPFWIPLALWTASTRMFNYIQARLTQVTASLDKHILALDDLNFWIQKQIDSHEPVPDELQRLRQGVAFDDHIFLETLLAMFLRVASRSPLYSDSLKCK